MDIRPLTPEEVDAVRASVPWVKILGSGWLLTLVVGLWKLFGIYRRLEDVEKEVKELLDSSPMTDKRHLELTTACQSSVDAKIKAAISELHIKVVSELSEIKETQCHILGELKQLTKQSIGDKD